MMIKFGLILSLLVMLSGCSTLTSPIPEELGSKPLACLSALVSLDNMALQSAGTLIGNRIYNKPWLRYNRLITNDIGRQTNTKNLNQLLQRMSLLAQEGLQYELAIIPKKHLQQWQKRYQIKTPKELFVKRCSGQLLRAQLDTPEKTLASLKAIPADSDYSTLARVAGLYPLATVPFRLGVVKEQKQLAHEWGKVSGKRWFGYRPNVKQLQENQLLASHAPNWYVDGSSNANLPGAPYWEGQQLEVNTQKPTTYAFVSEARFNQRPVTQLNYILWFAERPRLKRLDWVAGKHDAVVFRVNLDQDGEVIAYDSIHLCGCWYRLFLPDSWSFNRSQSYWREPISMHRVRLPAKSSPRMAIFIQSDTHQIQYIQPEAELVVKNYEVASSKHYALKPFSQLLKLPTATGVRPVFNAKGYVSGSERPERWLFWPMGVRNPGALRRFGDHAMSFVGRRYFDDPNLLSHFTLAPRNNNTGSNDNYDAH